MVSTLWYFWYSMVGVFLLLPFIGINVIPNVVIFFLGLLIIENGLVFIKNMIIISTFGNIGLDKKIHMFIKYKHMINKIILSVLILLLMVFGLFFGGHIITAIVLSLVCVTQMVIYKIIYYDSEINDIKEVDDESLIVIASSINNDLVDLQGKYPEGNLNVKV